MITRYPERVHGSPFRMLTSSLAFGMVSKTWVSRGIRRAMLRRADEVNLFAGFEIVFVVVSKKEARKLLRKKGSLVTVREVPELGIMFIEPVPFCAIIHLGRLPPARC